MPTREEIYAKVRESIVDALGVDEDEVSSDSSLVRDLGAESIDFLDIVFRLEKSFDVKIPRGDLFPDDIISSPEYVQGGHLTAEGVDQLKQRMPHADLSSITESPAIADVFNVVTVNAVVNYLESKISQNGSN